MSTRDPHLSPRPADQLPSPPQARKGHAGSLGGRVHLLTSSRLRLWQSCPRAHHYRYEVGLEAVGAPAHALAFGTALHAGLEAWWIAIGEGDVGRALSGALGAAERSLAGAQDEQLDPYDLAKLTAMLAAYDAQWQRWACSTEVLAVERAFSYELVSPWGDVSQTWRVAGKIDALVRLADGRVAIVEHKSSSSDASAGSDYRRRLTLDPQVSTYFDGVRALGWDADVCLYDVLIKPQIKPLKATPAESRKYTKAGALYANQRETDETPDEYRDRLIAAIAADPDRYLVHAEIVRTEQEREAHLWALWMNACAIDQTRAGAAHARDVRAVPQHSHACFQHGGGGCQYLPICEGTASARDETRYRRLRVIHPELENDTNENEET